VRGRPGGRARVRGEADARLQGTMSTDDGPARQHEELDRLRERIQAVDRELVGLVGERRDLALQIGKLKEALGLPVLDPPQEARVVRRAAEMARELGTDVELVRDVIWRIVAAARSAQEGRTEWGPPGPPVPPHGDADG